MAIVRERIRDKRKRLDQCAKTLKALHLRLATTLSPLDWEYIDRATTAMGELLLLKDTERHKKKFNNLTTSKTTTPPPDPKRLVINLSNQSIDEPTISVISKGLNFAPAPRYIPYCDIIAGVEPAVRKLPVDLAEEVRAEISMALKRAKLPKANISRSEQAAIRALQRNKAIKVLPADKGNATVLMNSEDYHQKILDILRDQAYRKINRDPTDSVTRKTIALIKSCGLPTDTAKNLHPPAPDLHPPAPVPPRLYGLPKIHKDGAPLRPIVSAIGSPTYNLAKFLTNILSPHVGNCDHHIKNSSEFVKTLADFQLGEDDIIMS
ncbi:uncharacterized protein LOC124161462 [Ischnura elegans]|uniref:uncharacterized protein LOC124161462 n=1 Tax=Ischnura elegans TaxID=197161 RepID=UPI001ED8839A|nr:uncharacterized protein LOC124161462 [Ischnura elegans]